MRLTTSGIAAGCSTAGDGVALLGRGGRGSPAGHDVPLAGRQQLGRSLAPAQSGLRQLAWRGNQVSIPPSRLCWPHTHCRPVVSWQVKFGALRRAGSPRALALMRGESPVSWRGRGGACSGETRGERRLGPLGGWGVPGRAGKVAPLPQHVNPDATALGGPVQPAAGPPGTAGPLRSHHALGVRHGSSR